MRSTTDREGPGALGHLGRPRREESPARRRPRRPRTQLGAAGQAEITKAFKDNDVEFAPRFGLSDSGAKTVAATGSLSVSADDLGADKPDELPAAQRCS